MSAYFILFLLINGSFSFSEFYLCHDISDPNICFEGNNWLFPSFCSQRCCNVHDNECTAITTPPPLTILNEMDNQDMQLMQLNNAMYHNKQCIYETSDALYNLYHLEISENNHSHYYTYESDSHKQSPFYKQWISMYLNICNKTSVANTEWNKPPNSPSLNKYVYNSTILCAVFADKYNHNITDSALCTQIGQDTYHTSDFMIDNNDLIINLGQTLCLYYSNWNTLYAVDIYVNLEIQCNKTTAKTQIISVDGPLYTMDNVNYPCSNNITITMATNMTCAQIKILANKSSIHCPRTFNQTTQIINCTLFARSNNRQLTGDMNDINQNYLSVIAHFGTKTHNISINMDIQSNKTGVFNITLNVTDIFINQLNNTLPRDWRNISMYAAASYPIGPNTTTKNVSILFENIHNSAASSSVDYLYGYGTLAGFILLVIYLCYRLKYEGAKKFCCAYCMRCKCMDYGISACLIGTYILCCDCNKFNRVTLDGVMRDKNETRKPLKDVSNNMNSFDTMAGSNNINNINSNSSLSFWGFMKDRLSKTRNTSISDEESQVSDYSRYDSMSEFLYRQHSGYAGHIGLQLQKSKVTPKHKKGSISSTDDYVI